MRKIRESGKQRQRFEVRLLAFPGGLGFGQHAIDQPDQMTRLAVERGKHAEMKLVIGNDVHGRIEAHEPARRAQVQRSPARGGRRDVELAQLGQCDHLSVIAGGGQAEAILRAMAYSRKV